MDSPGTVLIASQAGVDWSPTSDILSGEYGYRVLIARSSAEAATAPADAHVDAVIAEDCVGIGGRRLLAGLRTP
jgi:hypothetical protein